MRTTVLGLWLAGAVAALSAAELPPAPILMTTTATVTPGPAAGARDDASSPALPPPRQAALETAGMTPAQEARYRVLTKELRCPLCQNQSIADSDAPISADLRDQVRARILAGASDDDIRTFVTDRFGQFALYRPRFGGVTLWLWLAPLALLVVGGGLVWHRLRSDVSQQDARPGATDPDPDSDSDSDDRLARLLTEEGATTALSPPPPATPRTPA